MPVWDDQPCPRCGIACGANERCGCEADGWTNTWSMRGTPDDYVCCYPDYTCGTLVRPFCRSPIKTTCGASGGCE